MASECCYSFKVGGGAHSEMNDDSHTCGCSRCFVFVFSEWLTFCGLQPFWPLTPDTNEAFSSIQLPPSGYLFRDGCDVVKIPGGSQFLKQAHLEPVWRQQPSSPRSKSLQSPSFSILMLTLNFQQRVVFTTSSFLIASSCCHVPSAASAVSYVSNELSNVLGKKVW